MWVFLEMLFLRLRENVHTRNIPEKNPVYIVPHIIKNLVIQYVNEVELLPDLLN